MPNAFALLAAAAVSFVTLPAFAHAHEGHEHGAEGHTAASHKRGPNEGLLIGVGDEGYQVELLVQHGQMTTLRVMDKEGKPVAVDAGSLTLTFTEESGEVEDYGIRAAELASGERVFQRESSHVVEHIVYDPMSVTVVIGGKKHASAEFAYPFGPHGGRLAPLGGSKYQAELVVEGDAVRVHLLDNLKRPATVDAAEVTLTFTEADGETEDYTIKAKPAQSDEQAGGGKADDGATRGSLFERVSDHVVDHVKADKITVKLVAAGVELVSEAFAYGAG